MCWAWRIMPFAATSCLCITFLKTNLYSAFLCLKIIAMRINLLISKRILLWI